MSLRDGTKKMSKSDPSDYSRINLTDDADTIARNPQGEDRSAAAAERGEGAGRRPEADNLVGIYAALADKPRKTCCANSAARSCW
jgi:tryptophanyl-tRNA synthetase